MRYALRRLIQEPGVNAWIVFSLALGIGGNTLMFSIVQAVLVRSLLYAGSDRLVFVWFTPPNRPDQKRPATAAEFAALREQSRSLEHLGTVGGVGESANLTSWSGDGAERAQGQRFSAAIPRALGAQPLLGRWFTEAEAEPNADPVIVLSYRLWQRRFAGADVLGKSIRMDGEAARIIGVMPSGWILFNYPAEYWRPERLVLRGPSSLHREHVLAARIIEGVSQEQAQEEMNRIATRLSEAFPSTTKGWGIVLESALNLYVGWVRRPLLILQGAVACVLLIACANVAGLLLARAGVRRREVAVRAALGASRWRIVRQLLTESTLLSLLGGLLGVALAFIGLKLFVISGPTWFPRAAEIELDTQVLAFTAVLSMATVPIFGSIPAIQLSRLNLNESLKRSRNSTARTSRPGLRNALVIFEMSMALVLLIAAGLMVNTFGKLYNAPLGCNCRDAVTFQVRLPSKQYVREGATIDGQPLVEISPRVNTLFEQIRERVAEIPGVESAAGGIRPPLSEIGLGALMFEFTKAEQSEPATKGQVPRAAWFPVSASYFRTLGVPLLRGREFGIEGSPSSLPAVLINETMARRYWPGENPTGKRLRIKMVGEPAREIAGVVGDIRHNRFDRVAEPQMYVPYVQHPRAAQERVAKHLLSMTFVVRAKGDAARLIPLLRATVANVDRALPIFGIKTVQEYVSDQLWQPRQTMAFLVVIGVIAVMLAVTGVFGILAYTVQQRTHEIGIRVALGARPQHVLRLVMARGLLLITIGVIIGVAASLALTRLLESLLWGVTPTDPLTFNLVVSGLVAVALLACYLPARRALGIEPTVALRCE